MKSLTLHTSYKSSPNTPCVPGQPAPIVAGVRFSEKTIHERNSNFRTIESDLTYYLTHWNWLKNPSSPSETCVCVFRRQTNKTTKQDRKTAAHANLVEISVRFTVPPRPPRDGGRSAQQSARGNTVGRPEEWGIRLLSTSIRDHKFQRYRCRSQQPQDRCAYAALYEHGRDLSTRHRSRRRRRRRHSWCDALMEWCFWWWCWW